MRHPRGRCEPGLRAREQFGRWAVGLLKGDIDIEAFPWGIVIVGGPLLLGLALLWAMMRSRKASDRADPNTPSDDPSKGM